MGVRRCSWRVSTPPEHRPCAPRHGRGVASVSRATNDGCTQLESDYEYGSEDDDKRQQVHEGGGARRVAGDVAQTIACGLLKSFG